MSTCEENNDLLNIFNLISNIKEDLRKLKSLEIPSDENGIKKIKVYISRKYVAIVKRLGLGLGWEMGNRECPQSQEMTV